MLQGKIIITTQPADQAREMLSLLQQQGACAFNLPMIETRTLAVPEDQLTKLTCQGAYDLLVFTSQKGVKGLFENLARLPQSLNLSPQLPMAVVGNSTAAALKKYGHQAKWINPGKDAAHLAGFLLEKVLEKDQKVLLALGTKAPDFLEEKLSHKARVTRINVYETLALSPQDDHIAKYIYDHKANVCIFTSPSGVHAFLDNFEPSGQLNWVAIGNTTARAISQAGYQVAAVASEPSAQAVVAAIKDLYSPKNTHDH